MLASRDDSSRLTDVKQVWQLLGTSAVYYPQIAKVAGGVTAAVLWCAIASRQENGKPLTSTVEEMTHRTGLSRQEQYHAMELLKVRHLIRTKLERKVPETWSYTLNYAMMERLLDEGINRTLPASAEHGDGRDGAVAVPRDPHFPQDGKNYNRNVIPDYRFAEPWKGNQERFRAFQRALLEYAKRTGVPHPSGWTFKVIDSMTKGVISPYWEEFVAGVPLGSSQKVQREWEVEPGVPYPALEEERIQYYLAKGEPLETAVARARSELRDPIRGKDLWEGFLRKCDRLADEALKAKAAGVRSPYLPPSFSDRPPVTKESVMAKLEALQNPQQSLESAAEQNSRNSSEPPTLVTLQKLYATPMGRSLVEKQIREHPEWGYRIVDGKVIDSEPF